MEFKFRAMDEQASTFRPPSSSIGYFAEQAPTHRVRHSGPDLGRAVELFPTPGNVLEAIQREHEKEMIRHEIIAAEIARRRLLEAEVRMEMMLGRELARGRSEVFPIYSGLAAASPMRFEPRLPLLQYSEGRSLEDRLALSLEDRLFHQTRSVTGGFETFPFHRNLEPKISEDKPPSEVSKQKVIFLAKPEGNLSGTKHEAVTLPAAGSSKLPSVGVKRKAKEEWSCAICQVSATNEQGLNEHLKGRKHKAREAGLRAMQAGKNYMIGLFPKKSKPTKLVDTTDNKNTKAKLEENLLQAKSNTQDLSPTNVIGAQETESINASGSKNKELAQKMQKIRDHKRKSKFWCEMCQVGSCSEKVMNRHKNGKKHMRRLRELNKNGRSILAAEVKETPQENVPEEVAVKGSGVEDAPEEKVPEMAIKGGGLEEPPQEKVPEVVVEDHCLVVKEAPQEKVPRVVVDTSCLAVEEVPHEKVPEVAVKGLLPVVEDAPQEKVPEEVVKGLLPGVEKASQDKVVDVVVKGHLPG